jgi:hypothetical protein
VIIGAIGGCSVAILIGSLVYLLIQGAKAPLYVAAITSQFLENIYNNLLINGEQIKLINGIRKQIANRELDPVTGAHMISAIQGDTSIVAPALPALAPAAAGLMNGTTRRRQTRRFGGVRHKNYYKKK